jgi:hypothetical protein
MPMPEDLLIYAYLPRVAEAVQGGSVTAHDRFQLVEDVPSSRVGKCRASPTRRT